MSFADTPTPALLAVRANLLCGLDAVAAHIAAGTFYLVGDKGKAPPAESGNLTLLLLNGVDAELVRRETDHGAATARADRGR